MPDRRPVIGFTGALWVSSCDAPVMPPTVSATPVSLNHAPWRECGRSSAGNSGSNHLGGFQGFYRPVSALGAPKRPRRDDAVLTRSVA